MQHVCALYAAHRAMIEPDFYMEKDREGDESAGGEGDFIQRHEGGGQSVAEGEGARGDSGGMGDENLLHRQ